MQALFRNIVCGVIFLAASPNVFAVDHNGGTGEYSDPRFLVEHSTEYHPRFKGLLSLSLMNATQNSLDNYRIVAMIKRNIHEPFTPGNITEHVWRFVGDDDEVVLPLRNLGFTLVIYRGEFDDSRSDLDVVDSDNSKQVFILDGDEVSAEVRSLRLIVR